jgi:mannitol-1-phosphate 5-dehydrogenase
VHFGAGKIGRGFLADLYNQADFEVCFVDVVPEVVKLINDEGRYTLHIVGDAGATRTIDNVRALSTTDKESVAEAIAACDIVSTAVGPQALPGVAGALAAGLERRHETNPGRPLNVIVCENLADAARHLRDAVRPLISPLTRRDILEATGFLDASIGRMVPVMTREQQEADPLAVYVEPYCELPVDGDAVVGTLPDIPHLTPYPNFEAYVARKLYVHNLTHAAAAYLGYLKDYTYIWESIEDARVRKMVEGAGLESCRALTYTYGIAPEELHAHLDDLIERYSNRALGDTVARVAADPLRKLGKEDRLIGALRNCVAANQNCGHIALAAAAAIRYDNPEDPSAPRLKALLQAGGLDRVLQDVCGLKDGSSETLAIRMAWRRVQAGTI